MTGEGLGELDALDCRIAAEAPGIAATLLRRVKAALAKMGERGIVSGEGKPAVELVAV